MTKQKRLKDLIRARMQKTGERYTAARRHVLAQALPAATDGPERFHLPGNVPATTALRVLLSAANVRPTGGVESLSEALLFGIAGGVGAGVFAFRYEKEDFSSFFVAGRHLWQDDLAYLQTACQRLGIGCQIRETGGAKTAEKQLRAALETGQSVVAWVDAAGLPRRVARPEMEGGLYHVVTVYGIDDASEALIGDLADEPDRLPLDTLAQARQRIRKQKNRLMWISDAPPEFDAREAARQGIAACHDALVGRGPVKTPGGKGMAANFTLEAFQRWGERMHGGNDSQSWSRMFPRGVHLWRGLTSIYSFIHYGTGGGLTRPLYARFFRGASTAWKAPLLTELAERYERLGEGWDALGEAALPDEVTAFQRFKELSVEKAELIFSGGEQSADRIGEIWSELAELEKSASADFPLSEDACDALRAELKRRILELHQQETEAHQRLGELPARGF